MRNHILALGIAIGLAAGGFAQNTPASGLERELTACLQQMMDAAKNKDVAYFQRTLTDDYTYITPNGSNADKNDIVQAMRVEPKDTKDAQATRVYEIQVLPIGESAAVVTFNTIDPGGAPRYQHQSTVWVKQNGEWKLKFQQTTPNLWSLGDV
jgi:hypothetical protein